MEFHGVVNIDNKGRVVCFCTKLDALAGKCACQKDQDCPEAIINIEVLSGTRPSEKGIKTLTSATKKANKEITNIKRGLSELEAAVRKTKFRL